MYRSAIRATPRITNSLRAAAPRRFASTVPADKSRSWKSSAVRWGLAGAALYYYNTSTAFAEEPVPATVPAPAHFSDDDMTTVDAIVAQKRKEAEARQMKAASEATAKTSAPATTTQSGAAAASSTEGTKTNATTSSTPPPAAGSPEALEQEAGQQGAFNPETGEINWDCPCLGGMADGPCGEDFKAAFSCFVYSTEEPKGMDCIDKFQNMQDCFRQHPEIYGEELADDEEAGEAPAAPAGGEAAPAASARTAATTESSNAAEQVPEKESAPVATAPKTTAKTESKKPTEKKAAPKAEEKPKKTESKPKETEAKASPATPSPVPVELPASEFQPESGEVKADPRFDATAANAKVQN